jgi:hypothetical protein
MRISLLPSMPQVHANSFSQYNDPKLSWKFSTALYYLPHLITINAPSTSSREKSICVNYFTDRQEQIYS